MTCTLHVLGSTGDLTLSWNPSSPQEVEAAKLMVEQLRQDGYEFFRVDGSPAPEVIDAGIAVLVSRRIEAAEVVAEAEAPQPRRRGGPRRQSPPAAEAQPTRTVATRPLRGG